MITKDINEIKKIVEQAEKEGKVIMITNGCFDLVHAGHAIFIENAKKHCDVLIVAINSDRSVKELKGPSRPINNEDDRAYLVARIKGVDYVYIFDEKTFERTLKELKPKKYAKGQDYSLERIDQNEKKIIESYGGEILIIKHPIKTSTTYIINKILEK